MIFGRMVDQNIFVYVHLSCLNLWTNTVAHCVLEKLMCCFCTLEDLFLHSGGTDSLENFNAEFSASAPVVYKSPPPMGPEILYTTGAWEGVKVSVAIFPSSGGGV